jgi:multidrug resistance protein
MFAPAVPQVLKEFHVTNDDLGTWAVSIYVLGFAVGPLVVAPMSEMYGRRPVYIIACILFLAFTIGCAASSSLAMLVVFRFLAGCAGATPNTLGGATIGDLFPKEKRGAAMAVWGLGPMLGPAAGPVIGGFLSQAKSWRWAFWLQAIIAGVILILGIFLLRETYAVAILSRKTKRLIRETGNINLVSALHDGIPTDERFQRAIVRPMKLLIFSPIVLLLSIWVAVIFGYLYLYITTFPTVFQTRYGFSPGVTGLTYLGLGIGFFLGLGVVGSTSDIFYRRLTARNNGVSKPEFRLPPMAIASPFIAVSLFWYGWSAEARAHWIVPIIGTSFFGIGMMPSFVRPIPAF